MVRWNLPTEFGARRGRCDGVLVDLDNVPAVRSANRSTVMAHPTSTAMTRRKSGMYEQSHLLLYGRRVPSQLRF